MVKNNKPKGTICFSPLDLRCCELNKRPDNTHLPFNIIRQSLICINYVVYRLCAVSSSATKDELMVRTVSEIVSQLIKAHESGRELNVSK